MSDWLNMISFDLGHSSLENSAFKLRYTYKIRSNFRSRGLGHHPICEWVKRSYFGKNKSEIFSEISDD